MLSLGLFNLFGELIVRSLKDFPGVAIGGHGVNTLRYAGDSVLVAGGEGRLRRWWM